MPTRDQEDDPKQPSKSPPRPAQPAEERERERARHDPFADDNPAICRGID